MKTINVDLSTGEALNLLIGRQGENNVTQVIFDFSALKTEFGTGTLSLSVKRPKEYVPYAQTMTVSGTNATWLVNETDTGNFGCGEIQLTYTVSGKVAKTVIYKYTVYRSIGVDGEYPIPGQTWQEEIEEDISEIKEDLQELIDGGGGGSGMSAEFKQALHNILEKVAYIDDDGQTYLNALDSAMYPPVTAISLNTSSLSFATLNSTQQLTATTTPSGGAVTWTSSNTSIATVSSSGLVTSKGYGSATITATSGSVSATCSVTVAQATLSSISAVYTQSGTVYDSDSLDSLKSDLVVTAHWSNSTTSTVASTDYTLSGTLTAGTSTITVSYGGKTTTFNVTVTAAPVDTTAQLDTEHDGKGQSNTFLQYSNKSNFCPTIIYDFGTLSGGTYDYFKGIIPVDTTGSSTCRVWFWKQDNTGTTASAYGSGKPMQEYNSQSMTEGSIGMTVAGSDEYLGFTIPICKDYKDDAYLYVQSSGKVLFAGKNTPYYGMSNISEAS